MQSPATNHYATLGLDQRCTDAQIRTAYRLLSKQLHPDVNGNSPAAVVQTQALNAAYEILSDPARRREYDRELAAPHKASLRSKQPAARVTKEIHLRFEEFLRGGRFEVRVDDPGRPGGPEAYELIIPPETAPGTRFNVARDDGGSVMVRVKARPDVRFKPRGSDLRCDLKIRSQRAREGGAESLRGVTGTLLRVQIPAKVSRGEIIRLPGEGLPKPRGGRGDLLVRILYSPDVTIRR